MNEQDAPSTTAGTPRLRRLDRMQPDPDPRLIDELVPPDHVVRTVWELVEGLDFSELYAQVKAVEGRPDRPAVDPMIPTALWIYATLENIGSARDNKGDGEQARASTTDPEARRMKMPDGGFRPAYNVQFATTLDSLVIVGAEVTNAGADGGQMGPMMEQIQTQQGELPHEYYADGGFSTKDDIEHVEGRGVMVFTPVKEAERQQQAGNDPSAPRPGEGPFLTRWRERMGTAEGKRKYQQRSKCEWSNAQVRNRGLYRFLVRGLKKVKAIVLWHVLTHNLFRLVALRAQPAQT